MQSKKQSKYSDQLIDWLMEFGYTHCFFVAGGNIMHLLDSVRTRMTCVPFVHEVGAAIAAEYFNASRDESVGKAFALVTAGPGLTNAVTGMAGAWQESRELLVIGGQVKTTDLSRGKVRQRGIQEIDGVSLVQSITKKSVLLDKPFDKSAIKELVTLSSTPRMGPVFLEVCLDVQAASRLPESKTEQDKKPITNEVSSLEIEKVTEFLKNSSRPIFLIGGGVDRQTLRLLDDKVSKSGIPIMTSWNGSDRISNLHELYAGRPDTWGQRYANILIQQADLVFAIGARLSLQQTGFAWEEFAPLAKVVQVEIDKNEIEKGHPKVDLGINADANDFLQKFLPLCAESNLDFSDWTAFIKDVKILLPYNDYMNKTGKGFVDPYELTHQMGFIADSNDILLPCSSGGAATVSMQTFVLRDKQKLVGDKSLASMGYGLSGAIGCAIANPKSAVFLNEGDGGLAQNLQEFGTLAATKANVKVFIWSNNGYASIRMTQKNYFDGAWIGCDSETGLGLPNWQFIAAAYNLKYFKMDEKMFQNLELLSELKSQNPLIIEVPIDPEQTYFPKISSSIQPDGSMKSSPLHSMSPELPDEISKKVLRYLNVKGRL